MKYDLLPSQGTFFKANLHSHSTVSDGCLSPQELKTLYQARGYSVLAITDHEYLMEHCDLNDERFLTITGYEMGLRAQPTQAFPFPKVCHLNLYAKKPTGTPQVCYHPERMPAKLAERPVRYTGPLYPALYCPQCVNHIIEQANANGFLVCYNHPHWSLEDLTDFSQYEGLFAMEIHNTDCRSLGVPEWNEQSWEWMLRRGKRLFCLAADDNHNKHPLDDPRSDSFGGWVMIAAPRLSYEAVIHALEQGHFYASTGPEIHELYLSGGEVHIVCTPAREIRFNTFGRKSGCFRAPAGGSLCRASFPVPKNGIYFRLCVTDSAGNQAATQPYWLDRLPNVEEL